MAEKFSAEIAEVRAQAGSLQDLGSRLGNIMSTLHGNLAGEGSPWGGDEPGQQFSSSYLPQKQRVDTATDGQTRFLAGNADALNTAANTAEQL